MPNLKHLPSTGYAPDNESIAKHLRELADYYENAEISALRNIYIVFESVDGMLDRQVVGYPCDKARLVGVLTMMCSQISTHG